MIDCASRSTRYARHTMMRFGLACLVAVVTAAGHAQQPDVVGSIAAENALLSAQIADAATALDSAQRELARLRKAKSDLEARMQQIERRASEDYLNLLRILTS